MSYRDRVLMCYKKHRRNNLSATKALRYAKYEAKFGYGSFKQQVMPDPDPGNNPQRKDLPNGWYYTVELAYDNDSGPPWKDCDGHGVVSDWEHYRREYDEWLLNSDHHSYRYYEWKESLAIALKDKWDAPPYNTGNAHEQALRAVKHDYEFLRRWCNDDWYYVGLIVTLYDDNSDEISSDSCWGYDSDSEDYLCEQARSWAAHMIKNARKEQRESARRERANNRFIDAMENSL